jgi:2-oxoisovalerate dehydrogenase E2 component (dihydrolipoyl transacylase)
MSVHVFKLPDLGEGTVSAEVVNWLVKPGDVLKEDQPMVEMSTDKAVVEIPAPVSGRVLAITGKPGDVIAVGAELAIFDTADTAAAPQPRPRQSWRHPLRARAPRARQSMPPGCALHRPRGGARRKPGST